MRRILANVTLLLVMLLTASQAFAQLRIEITETAGVQDKIPIAIVPFGGRAVGVPVDVAAIIQADLERSGRFNIIPADLLPSNPATSNEITFTDWRNTGIEYLVVGQINDAGGGNFDVVVELVDIVKQRQLMGKANANGQVEYCCRFPPTDLLRLAAHKASNRIYEEIVGVKGVFDTRFAYITSSGPLDARRYALELADIDGENIERVLEIGRPVLSPTWSPDGVQLAYVTFEFARTGRSAIIVHHLSTADRHKLISIEGINGAPSWSPDGRRLALSLSHRGSPDIYIVNIASGQLSQLTTSDSIETEATWLDDNTVAFTSNRSGSPQIYRKGLASGSRAQRITFEGNYNAGASASPDGSKIAFIHNDNGNFRIAVQDVDNGVLEVLTTGQLDESPSFSPNGDQILYSTKEQGRDVLGIVSVDGLVEQRIRLANDNVRDPAWGPRR